MAKNKKEESFNLNFNFSSEEIAAWKWDWREAGDLQIDIVDLKTDEVQVRYTKEKFHVVEVDTALVNESLDIVKDILFTALLIGKLTPEERLNLRGAYEILKQNLPGVYEKAIDEYYKKTEEFKQTSEKVIKIYKGGEV